MPKVALVTGTSTGIGLATSVALAKVGFTVVATMRDVGKAEALEARAKEEGVGLEVLPLDVTDHAAIDDCVSHAVTRHGQVDVLVNNAGAGHVGTLEQTSIEDARRTLEVDFFGVWNMTRAVLPHMRAAGGGRIISLSSVGGIVGQPFNDAYCAAKFAVEGLMESLLPVLRQFGIYVSLVEPGPVNTNFVNNVSPSFMKLVSDQSDPYLPALSSYIGASQKVFNDFGQTGDDIAQVIVEAATAETPHLRYQTSQLSRALAERKFADPDGDSILAINGVRLTPA